MSKIQYKSPFTYLVATLFTLPNTVLLWFIIMYPVSGVTGNIMHPFYHYLTCLIVFLVLWSWTLLGSEDLPEIIYRSCRLGALLSLLLPAVTAIISFLWVVSEAGRPIGFLDGYSALEIPVYAAASALLFIVLFLTGSYFAARHIDGVPF